MNNFYPFVFTKTPINTQILIICKEKYDARPTKSKRGKKDENIILSRPLLYDLLFNYINNSHSFLIEQAFVIAVSITAIFS